MKHERFRRLTGEQMVWTQHENTADHGVCPIDRDEHVKVVWSDGHKAESNAGGLNWAKHNVGDATTGPTEQTRTPVTHYSTCEPRFPELAKEILAKQEGSQEIGNFLEWLQDEGITLGTAHEDSVGGLLQPANRSAESLIAGFFGIDMKKAEAERRQLLDEFVASQAVQP